MNKEIIVSVAPVQAGMPVDADLLAWDMEKCAAEGASVCHLHSRLPGGTLTPDISYMSECFDKISERTDLMVQVSTGGVSGMNIRERCRPLDYSRAETASLNAGSTNLGDAVYINTFEDIAYCAKEVYSRRIIPDVEVFDIGMINNVILTSRQIPFRQPIFYNLVFRHRGGMPPTVQALTAFLSMVPRDAKWGVTHYSRSDWRFLAAAIAMGASTVRIGFEDSAYLAEGRQASYNYELVQRLAALIRNMGLKTASPNEARQIMGCLKHD